MKIGKENVSAVGFSRLYEPDEPRDGGLDIVFIHGLGGHPVHTWLHAGSTTPPGDGGHSTSDDTDTSPAWGTPPRTPPTPGANHAKGAMIPSRRRTLMRDWASPNNKKGRTLTKAHQYLHRRPSNTPLLAPPRDPPGPSAPSRPRSAEESIVLPPPPPGRLLEVAEEPLPLPGIRPPRPALVDVDIVNDSVLPVGIVPPTHMNPQQQQRGSAPAGKNKKAAKAAEVYWPLDLLPDACPDARVFTFGYETLMAAEGQLVPGQMDVFERGRHLLEGMEEVRRIGGGGREVVFVAHSTGAIIVKEMLRLASTFSDTQSEPLLASIAGVVFLGAPLRGTNYGTIIAAMRSMASQTTGVSEDDEDLAELLGGGDLEIDHLAHAGCESFERVRMDFNFRVKTFRETAMRIRTRSWAEWGLALRRDASALENNPEEDEDIEADHIEVCRFGSSWDDGYLSVSSFLKRLAHHPTLRKRELTERERSILRALADPEHAEPEWEPAAQHQEKQQQQQPPTPLPPPASSSSAPAWLLSHAHFRGWLHRSSRQTRQKLLWMDGPVGCRQSSILSAVQRHIAQHWTPAAAHSSIAIITVTARERESMLESVWLKKTITDGSIEVENEDEDDGTGEGGEDRPIAFVEAGCSLAGETRDFSQHNKHKHKRASPAAPATNTPAGALRSILSQLYGLDPRLRNLVLKKATTSLHGGSVFETTTPSARQTSVQKVYTPLPIPDHSKSNIDEHENRQSTTTIPGIIATPPEKTHEGLYQKQKRPTTSSTERRWSDPTDSTTDLLVCSGTHPARDSQSHLFERGVEAVRARSGGAWAGARTGTQPPFSTLEDVDIVSLFLEDYLCLDLARGSALKHNGITTGSSDHNRTDDSKHQPNPIIEIPGLRRVFILVDAATGTTSNEYTRGLLWCLSQLAQHSDFSICVATAAPNPAGDAMARSTSRSTSLSALPIMMTENNAEEIRSYVESHLDRDIEERDAIAAKMLDRSGGVMLWAEMVCVIVNQASEEGVSGEVVLGMLDDVSPRGNGRLDDLYAWKLGRLNAGSTEQTHARAVFQWVVLAPEALRLNELLVALRLTLLTRTKPREGKAWWETGVGGLDALDVDPPMSLNDLRQGAGDELGLGIAMDSPSLFWRWVQTVSQGLLKLESGAGEGGISNEPLGLQRVRPVDESVLHFFLKGKGFQTLLAPPEDPREKLPSTERFIDSSYFALLHTCLRYLSMTELDSLGREKQPTNPTPGDDLPPEETSKWRKHAEEQRKRVVSSYPFLRYAVDNLVFHLLCPRHFRYFLPQKELLQLLSANRCRMWRRWTHLLGFGIADAEPQAILAKAGQGPARRLLDPVYGAKYRLERVLKRVWKTAVEAQRSSSYGGIPGPRSMITPKRPGHFRSRSDVSESSMVFTLVGGDDPLKSQWMVPTWPSAQGTRTNLSGRSRARSNSSPATPRSPGAYMSPSPGALAGIQEMT